MRTFTPNFSSLSLAVWELRCSKDLEEKDDLTIEIIKGVCKSTPATPDLLNIIRTAIQMWVAASTI